MKILFLLTLCASSFTSYNFNNDFSYNKIESSVNIYQKEDIYFKKGDVLNDKYYFDSYITYPLNKEQFFEFTQLEEMAYEYSLNTYDLYISYTFTPISGSNSITRGITVYNANYIYMDEESEIVYIDYVDFFGNSDTDSLSFTGLNLNYITWNFRIGFLNDITFNYEYSNNDGFASFIESYRFYSDESIKNSNYFINSNFKFLMTPYQNINRAVESFYYLNPFQLVSGDISSYYDGLSYSKGLYFDFIRDNSSITQRYAFETNDLNSYYFQFYNYGGSPIVYLQTHGVPYYNFKFLGVNYFNILSQLFLLDSQLNDLITISGTYNVNPQLFRRFQEYSTPPISSASANVNFISNGVNFNLLHLNSQFDTSNQFYVWLEYGTIASTTRVYHIVYDTDDSIFIREEYNTAYYSIEFTNQLYTADLMAILLIAFTPYKIVANSYPGDVDGGSNGWLISTFDLIGFAFGSFISLFNVSIFPMITLGAFVLIPLTLGLILFIVNLFKR